MPTYTNMTYYASSGAATGLAPTWTSPGRVSGVADTIATFCPVSGGTNSAMIYGSGFNPGIPTTANIASGTMNVVHRQASGAVGATVIGQFFAGLSPGVDVFFGQSLNNAPTGAAYTTFTTALPAALMTATILNDPRFYCGITYSGVSGTGSMDVDSIYLTIAYDVGGTPFYKTTSLWRNGVGHTKK